MQFRIHIWHPLELLGSYRQNLQKHTEPELHTVYKLFYKWSVSEKQTKKPLNFLLEFITLHMQILSGQNQYS